MPPIRLPKKLPPFRLPQRARASPRVANVAQAQAKPAAVAPSSASASTQAQARRGLSEANQTRVVQTAKVVATGAAVASGGLALGYGGREVFEGLAAAREANKPSVTSLPSPDGEGTTIIVRNPDGTFSSFGDAPSYTKEPKASTVAEVGDTAKAVGLVVVGLIVVGAAAYVATRPEILKKLAGAIR